MYVRDANDYKGRILELYNNNGLRYDMGNAGRRFVEAGSGSAYACWDVYDIYGGPTASDIEVVE